MRLISVEAEELCERLLGMISPILPARVACQTISDVFRANRITAQLHIFDVVEPAGRTRVCNFGFHGQPKCDFATGIFPKEITAVAAPADKNLMNDNESVLNFFAVRILSGARAGPDS